MKKALFLDRDGIVNKELGNYVTNPLEFELNKGIGELIHIANTLHIQVIIITNQGGIAKGLYSNQTLDEIHLKMKNLLKSFDAEINDLYYCPHHPEINGKCLCRKPESLLFQKALSKHQLIAKNCLMIGDRDRDLEAAIKVDIPGVLISSNQTETLLKNDLIKSFLDL